MKAKRQAIVIFSILLLAINYTGIVLLGIHKIPLGLYLGGFLSGISSVLLVLWGINIIR